MMYRVLLFTPVVTAASAAAVPYLEWMYAPGADGFFNLIARFGGPRTFPMVARSAILAMLSVVILGVWKSIGYNVVIFYAGLRNIAARKYREAARIDGASTCARAFAESWFLLLWRRRPTSS